MGSMAGGSQSRVPSAQLFKYSQEAERKKESESESERATERDRERDEKDTDTDRYWKWEALCSQACPSDVLPPARRHLLKPPRVAPPTGAKKCSNTWSLWGHSSFKPS